MKTAIVKDYEKLREYINSGDILLYKPKLSVSSSDYTKAVIMCWNGYERLETIGIGEDSQYVSKIIEKAKRFKVIKPLREEIEKTMAVIDTMEGNVDKNGAVRFYLKQLGITSGSLDELATTTNKDIVCK